MTVLGALEVAIGILLHRLGRRRAADFPRSVLTEKIACPAGSHGLVQFAHGTESGGADTDGNSWACGVIRIPRMLSLLLTPVGSHGRAPPRRSPIK